MGTQGRVTPSRVLLFMCLEASAQTLPLLARADRTFSSSKKLHFSQRELFLLKMASRDYDDELDDLDGMPILVMSLGLMILIG